MRRTVEQMIEKSINEGYEMKTEGTGKDSCESSLAYYRSLGYDVRTWYKERTGEYPWVLYAKMKSHKNQIKPTVDYSSMTVKELRVLCKTHSIPHYYKKSKQELVEALQLVA